MLGKTSQVCESIWGSLYGFLEHLMWFVMYGIVLYSTCYFLGCSYTCMAYVSVKPTFVRK